MIDDINGIIDNPSQRSVSFNQSYTTSAIDPRTGKLAYYNAFDIFNLGKKSPNRRVNHDAISSTAMGMMSHGPKGAAMANLHVALDVISEDWRSLHLLYVYCRFRFSLNLLYILALFLPMRTLNPM
jgi:hypothetical protein